MISALRKLLVVAQSDASLDAVTRREQSLNLFHALGKVFYNKSECKPKLKLTPGLGDPSQDKEDAELLSTIEKLPPDDPLPEHLATYDRRKSLVQMEVSCSDEATTNSRHSSPPSQ